MGAPAGPILVEGGRELAVQLGPGIIREELVGHVALRLGGGVIIRQVHGARRRVGDSLVYLGPRVEIEQSSYYLAVDLTGIIITRQCRADAGADRGTRGVVGQLSRHETRDLRLRPVRQQGLVDQELHLRGVLVLFRASMASEMAVFISAVLL